MSMKHILVLSLCICFWSCNVKNDDIACPPDPSPDLMEVVVHEFASGAYTSGVAGTLPDGSQSRVLTLINHISFAPNATHWPSLGSDGSTLLFTDYYGLYSFSLLSGRVTYMARIEDGYSFYMSRPYFSRDMREILGTEMDGNIVFTVNRSNGLTNHIFGPATHSVLTGDDSRFVFIEDVQALPLIQGLVSVDRSGRDRKTIREFDAWTDREIIALASIPASGSREFIYLERSAINGEYRFVKTDVGGSYEITMDTIPLDEDNPQEILFFTANENADKITYFTRGETVPFELVVRNYSNDRLTGVTVIPMPVEMEFTVILSYLRPQLSKIDRNIWNRLPIL